MRSPLIAALAAFALLAATPRPAAAFWSEVLSHRSSGNDPNHHPLDDHSGAGAGLCLLAGTVIGIPVNLSFGIYDSVIGLLKRRPTVRAGVAEILLTLPQLIICGVGIGYLSSPIAPRTAGENGIFVAMNVLLMVTPLVLLIHGLWAVARDKSADPPRAALVPTLVGDGASVGPGLALGGVW